MFQALRPLEALCPYGASIPQQSSDLSLLHRNLASQNDSRVQDTTVNLFETTIRILGGLLSTFYLTGGDQVYLYKAVELGMRMTPGFHSPSGWLLSVTIVQAAPVVLSVTAVQSVPVVQSVISIRQDH